jgi:hypothetical protein
MFIVPYTKPIKQVKRKIHVSFLGCKGNFGRKN